MRQHALWHIHPQAEKPMRGRCICSPLWTAALVCQTPSKRRTDGQRHISFSVRLLYIWSLTRTNGRTDEQTRTATASTVIAAVTPCRRRCDSSTVSGQKRTDRRRESNFVHFWPENVTSGGNNLNAFPDN